MAHSETQSTRRDFVIGAAALTGAGLLAGTAQASAAPASSASSDTKAAQPMSTLDLDLPDAAPIAPLDPPETWDDEADIVIVGLGGGGLAASLYAAEAGAKVIAVEKDPDVGGATQHACGWFTLPGGSKAQDEMQYAYPSYPYDPVAFMRAILPYYNYTVDTKLLTQIANKGGECVDWLIDHDEPLTCSGPLYLDSRVQGGIQPLGMRFLCQDVKQKAIDAGADLRLSTACDGLVMDGGRVVGIKTLGSTNDEEKFIRADKGVILCSGSFGMNRDMLAKYCPTAYRNAVVGGPIPNATGECTRMAIGAGADMCGIDSWCCWEAYPDRMHMGDGSFYTYHWDGSVILCRQPWLTIDKLGNHLSYYSSATEEHAVSYGGTGDYINAATHMSRMGGGAYVIFDADYEAHIAAMGGKDGAFGSDREVLTPERLEKAGVDAEEVKKYCALDYREDVAKGLELGDIRQADTLEELAEQLGLDADVVTKAVQEWNDMCATGVDDKSVFPLKPEWLIPIEKAPFFGARIGGGVGKTFAGPRVTPNLEVIDTNAHVIPGLYAHFMTAGGICGENCYNGTMFNTSIQGGNALSWISGYVAAQSALGELNE